HAPYHDQAAWDVMLKAAYALKPTMVVVLGDFCDFYAVSSHSRDPSRGKRLKPEVEQAKGLLSDLDDLNAKRKVFVEGNHEDRLRRYLWDKAPALFGMVDTASLLELDDWEFVPYGSGIDIGKIYVTHDLRRAGKYAIHHALDDAGKSIVIGHLHRMGTV